MAQGKERKETAEKTEHYPAAEARGRFERAVDFAIATKPMHKPAKAKRKRRR